MKEQRAGAPVFVKVEDYKEILYVFDMIKDKIKEMRETLNNIGTLRNEEDSDIAMWNKAINDIERKIDTIDKMMFEPEHSW